MESAARIWKQGRIPVIYRREGSLPLMIRLPYEAGNRGWLRGERRRKPVWQARFKCWEVPAAWFNDLVNECLWQFGSVYVIQPYREKEKCAPACWEAQGYDCQCSCMGANHGMNFPGGKWRVISETCAVQFGERKLACRLIEKAGFCSGR